MFQSSRRSFARAMTWELGTGSLPEDRAAGGRLRARVYRHVAWARHDGLARLVEEDDLDPRQRLRSARAARQWRAEHGVPAGAARAVFVVGVQRSGTNMIVRGIERDPSVETHNENDSRVFDRFCLREDDVVRGVVARSRSAVVLFKPLCDSHRTAELLTSVATSDGPAPLAVWVYRDVDARARSAVHKFGDVNRRVLTEIADGTAAGRWQAHGLSESSLELIRRLRPATLSPVSAAALFWLVRNRLYLEQGLDRRRDVHLVSYDRVVADPEPEVEILARFLGMRFSPAMTAGIECRAGRPRRSDLDLRVRAACTELELELGLAAERSARRVLAGRG
ncbi:MAG: hypothetical protein JWO11_456 [Nocardioides sp.]|nr:hypothetical protein [Nocardioides sp.]